jgi:hypothetical protein
VFPALRILVISMLGMSSPFTTRQKFWFSLWREWQKMAKHFFTILICYYFRHHQNTYQSRCWKWRNVFSIFALVKIPLKDDGENGIGTGSDNPDVVFEYVIVGESIIFLRRYRGKASLTQYHTIIKCYVQCSNLFLGWKCIYWICRVDISICWLPKRCVFYSISHGAYWKQDEIPGCPHLAA